MPDALIIDAVRSPIGKKNGTLASVRADELAGQVPNGLVDRVGIDPAEIEDVQMGCVSQVGEQALNVGRVALLAAARCFRIRDFPASGSSTGAPLRDRPVRGRWGVRLRVGSLPLPTRAVYALIQASFKMAG